MNRQNEYETYYIPPNFIEGSTLFGGMFKLRNVFEAGILAAGIGIPIFLFDLSLTVRIILLCLTALPAALIALIGISGECLSSFVLSFFKFLFSRRVIGNTEEKKKPAKTAKRTAAKETTKRAEDTETSMLAEIIAVIRKRSAQKEKPDKEYAESAKKDKSTSRRGKTESRFLNPVAEYLPVEKIENGIIYTKDHRYIKIIEVIPINFLLRSAREQRNIIYSFISYLKISPAKIQFKVLTKRADINRHLDIVKKEMERETDANCRMLQKDYLHLIDRIGSKEATTRRFFISFEYESIGRHSNGEEDDAIASLQVAARTAMNYLKQCGNEVVVPENEDEFTVDVLYNILCRQSSADIPMAQRVQNVVSDYLAAGRDTEDIPSAEFFAPKQIDYTHGKYICVDGLYHSYLLIPSFGYKSQVTAGWLSLIVNAGDGIDMDLFLSKQPKERMVSKLGQQIRINRSKIKEASDTNTDFDDLDGAIRSGYFLKNGLANNEDFYYMNLLITITADTVEDLEWREREMRKLLLSQDLNIVTCSFREEQAFLSALPLATMEKHLSERSKRNVLTSGAASCYPFTAYELCDDNGIMLGVNKFNNSLTIVDIFNSRNYKNANISIMGTSGAGKTFTMQLMGLRMRRKGIQVFVIAPLKGHEFHRACTNIGGEFISISPASSTCINVMEIRKVDKSVDELLDGGRVERSELASKIQQLHIFFSLLIPDITHEERQLLDEALIRTYAGKGITHDNDSLTDPMHPERYKEMPILGDLYDVLIASQETKRLANILNRLVHGSAQTFSRQTNVDLDNKYTVLDISELTGDLLTVGMFVALDFVWDKAKENRAVEKAIFIDECWKLIGAGSNRLAAEYVLEIFKIIRGYGGSAVCATQDINDFFALEDGKYGKGIINNCKTKIVLNLEDDEAQRVQSIMRLSEAEVMEITHFERGNGLISTNNNNVTVEFKCSDLEKSLITTDRRELQELIEQKKHDGR